jgi:hypothetical protein
MTRSHARTRTAAKCTSVAIATAFAALTIATGVAHAAPHQCGVLNGPMTINHNDGFTIKVTNWNGASADSTPDAATLYLPNGNPAQIDGKGYPTKDKPGFGDPYNSNETGTVSGGTEGNNINFSITWNELNPKVAMTSTYSGTIFNGNASGTDTNSQNHVKGETWTIGQAFQCT